MSSKPPDPVDFERDIPTTAEDVAALSRIRESQRLSFADYLLFLSRLDMPDSRPRKTFERCEPFEL